MKYRENIELYINTVKGKVKIIYENVLWSSQNKNWILYKNDFGIIIENTKEGFAEYPIIYDDDTIVYDNPYIIPKYVKENIKKKLKKYKEI